VSVGDHLEAAAVNDDEPLITTERLDAVTEAIAATARESFAVFRRTIRPDMSRSPFVGLITRVMPGPYWEWPFRLGYPAHRQAIPAYPPLKAASRSPRGRDYRGV
jgi:hypothetical protein